MSIKLMAEIWENGPKNQSETMVLLALADYANDAGVCWPSINGLMKKSRLSERGVQTVLKRLRMAGWVEIEVRVGRRNCNLYTIKTPQQMHPAADAPPQMNAETPQMDVKNPAASAPEPLRTINNHQISKREDKPNEISEAVEIYNHAAQQCGWSQVQRMIPARTKALKSRIKEVGGIDGWILAIEKAKASDFLCGKNDRGFKASFDFLTRQSSFAKLMEGNYDNRNSNGSGGGNNLRASAASTGLIAGFQRALSG